MKCLIIKNNCRTMYGYIPLAKVDGMCHVSLIFSHCFFMTKLTSMRTFVVGTLLMQGTQATCISSWDTSKVYDMHEHAV